MHSLADVEGDDNIEVFGVSGGGVYEWAVVNLHFVYSNEKGE